MATKPAGEPVEIAEVIEQARASAEERLTAIYRSIFTGKQMERQPAPPPVPIERLPR